MGVKLYREGKTCEADPAQIPSMEKAGWSKREPEAASESAPANTESAPQPNVVEAPKVSNAKASSK